MKFILSILFSLTLGNIWAEDGIKFFKGTLKEAQKVAAAEHKLIFMDAYATWCGPCKRMAKDVFTDATVGTFFNKHFINLKIDMEKGEGPQLASKYRVRSYPTLIFMDDKGEVVHAAKGGRAIEQFIGLGKLALSKNDKSAEYTKLYEDGDRTPSLLKAYAYALMNSAKPPMKIANEYIKTQDDLDSAENLEFLFDFANDADAKIFDLMVAKKTAIIAIKSKNLYEDKVKSACNATINKAVEFKVESLMDLAKKKMKVAHPKYYKEYCMLAPIQYAAALENQEDYIRYVDKYLKKYGQKNAVLLHQYAATFLRRFGQKPLLERAEIWAKKACELDAQKKYLKTYAALLQKLGKETAYKEVLGKIEALDAS
jgi:thioredoxin-related protein